MATRIKRNRPRSSPLNRHIASSERIASLAAPNSAKRRSIQTDKNLEGEWAFADPLKMFGYDQFAAYNPSELVTHKGLEIFDEMILDDQLASALAFKKRSVMASGWEIRSPEHHDSEWPPSEFIRNVLTNMKQPLEHVLDGVMTASEYGFSICEMVFEQISGGDWDGKLGIKVIKPKRPHNFEFKVDPYGNVEHIVQKFLGINDPKRNLDPRKFIHFKNNERFGNPYGHSDLEAAYRPWFVSDNANKWLAMMLERYGIPPMFFRFNPNSIGKSDQLVLKNIVETLQAATSAMIPGGKDSIELITPTVAGQVSTVFIPTLEYMDRAKARALQMPGLLGVTNDAMGSFARAKVVFDLFLLVIEYIRKLIASQVMDQQVIRPLIEMNFTKEEYHGHYPEFHFSPLTEPEYKDLMSQWRELTRVGSVKQAPEDEPHIRSLLGFPQRQKLPEDVMPITPKEVFGYHLAANMFKVNELRRAFGMEPINEPWADLPTGITAQMGIALVDEEGNIDLEKLKELDELHALGGEGVTGKAIDSVSKIRTRKGKGPFDTNKSDEVIEPDEVPGATGEPPPEPRK